MGKIIFILVLLLSNHFANGMQLLKSLGKIIIFGSSQQKLAVKDLTQEQKDQEFVELCSSGEWEPKESCVGYIRLNELIIMGANVNATSTYDGRTLLMEAIDRDYYELTKLLLRIGADPNIISTDASFKAAAAKLRKNATFFGAEERMADLYDQMARGATIRNSALLTAVLHRKCNFVQLLLVAGADREMKNSDNQTALDIAREMGVTEIVDLVSKMQKIL